MNNSWSRWFPFPLLINHKLQLLVFPPSRFLSFCCCCWNREEDRRSEVVLKSIISKGGSRTQRMVERKETNGQFKIVQPLKVCCGGQARDNCVKKKEKKARKELNQSPSQLYTFWRERYLWKPFNWTKSWNTIIKDKRHIYNYLKWENTNEIELMLVLRSPFSVGVGQGPEKRRKLQVQGLCQVCLDDLEFKLLPHRYHHP